MENNVKKLSAILLCCLMIITCSLAGCATFSIDRVKYYNEVVATVGDTNITRADLISAYSNYGYSYFVSQQGQTETEAMNSTLDILIDRELLYQYALDNDDIYRPTAYQVNEGIQTLFDSLDEQMATYVEEAKIILNIDIASDSEEDTEDEETAYTYEDYVYSKRAKVLVRYYTDTTKTTESSTPTEYREYYIQYITESEPDVYDKLISDTYLNDFNQNGTIDAIIESYFTHFRDSLINEDSENIDLIYNKVRSLLAKDLINYEYYLRDENGNEYSKDTESLIYRYFERNFESQIQSIYLTNIQTHFLENENLSIQALLDEYNYLTEASYLEYRNFEESYKSDMQDIGTGADSIYYHPTNLSDGTQFGYFIHTLITVDGLDDALTALENNAELKEDPDAYEAEYNRIIAEYLSSSNLQISVRDMDKNSSTYGLMTDETVSFNTVLQEYNEITKITDYETKLNAFIQFMFKYTGDDSSSLVSGMPYVVGTNGYSSMDDAFTDEAVRLITDGTKGGTTPASTDNLCVSSYGVHFLFYVGEVGSTDYYIPYSDRDLAYIQSDNKSDNGMYNLYYKILNPLTGETYFDMLFDAVYPAESDESNYTSNNGYTDYEENLINTSMITHKVVKYTTKINSTRSSI